MASLVSPPVPQANHEPSENWDDDFEFNPTTAKSTPRRPSKKPDHAAAHNDNRKLSMASSILEDWDAEPSSVHAPGASTEPETENWDDDYEDTRGSPRKPLTMRAPPRGLGEENWDEDIDEEDEEDENTADFGVFGDKDEDRTVTAKSRRAALSRLASDIPPPPPLPAAPPTSMSSLGRPFSHYSPSSSVFSVPTTIHTYNSTTHLRPTSAFALLPPSPPIHRERERRRLKKKSRPRPQGVFELGTIPAGVAENRYSFSDDGDASGNELPPQLRGETPKSDHESASSVDQLPPSLPPPPPAASTSSPPTTSKGGALLSRIGSVKRRWDARRRGTSTTPAEVAGDTSERADHVPRPQSSMSSIYNSASSQRNSLPNAPPSSPPPTSGNWFFRASSSGSGPSSPRRQSVKSEHRPPFPTLPPAPTTPTRRRSSLKKSSRRSTSRSRGGAGELVTANEPQPDPPEAPATRRRERKIERVDTRSPPSTSSHANFPPAFAASTSTSATTTPTKLIKRKSLGFVHLGRSRAFGGHTGSGHNEENNGGQEEYGKSWVSRYAGLGMGRAGSREPEGPNVDEERPRRRSISRLLSSDSHHHPPNDGNTPPSASKEGSRFLMGSMRRLSLVSSRHKRTKSGSGVPLNLEPSSRDSTPPPMPPGRHSSVPPSLPPLPTSISQLSLSLRVPSGGSGIDSLLPPSTEPSLNGSRQTSGSSSKSALDDHDPDAVPPVPPVPPELQSPPLIQRRGSKSSRKSRKSLDGTGRRRSVSQSRSASASGHSTSRKSSFERELLHTTPTASSPRDDRDREPKTPSRPPLPLLPPIELHPPSPPETVTKPKPRASTVSSGGDNSGAVQRLVFEALSPTLSLSSAASTSNSGFFTPLSASPKHGVTQAASLGRSTPIKSSLDGGVGSPGSIGAGKGTASGGAGLGLGSDTPVARRNSLGDLKIPARISQAQVGLRRDLGMVREFANHIQQLKDLQATHTQLVCEVQTRLDDHADQYSHEAGVQVERIEFATALASPTSESPFPPTPVSTSAAPSLPASSSQVAYRDLAVGFCSISARYRISWECAELLVELAGGRDKDEPDEPPERRNVSAPNPAPLQGSASLPSSVFTGQVDDDADYPASKPLSPSSSRSTPPSTQSQSSSWKSSTGRNDLSHRQLALLREMLNHGPVISPDENGEGDLMQHLTLPEEPVSTQPYPQSPLSSPPPQPYSARSASTATTAATPLSSPPIANHGLRAISNLPAAWGSVSQLHLHNGMGLTFPLVTQYSTGGAVAGSGSGNASRDVSGTSSAMGTITGPNPTTTITQAHLALGASANRDWRWGDARNSTITLPSEEGGGFGGGGGGDAGSGKGRKDKVDRERKRRSGRLAGMVGIRDMLRALKRGKDAEAMNGTSANARGSMGRSAFASMSTTSLSTDNTHGGGGLLPKPGHRYPHPRVASGSRRKSKISTGPESIGIAGGGSIGIAASAPSTQTPISFHQPPKASARRPSLASIFRIGKRPMSTVVSGGEDAPPPQQPPANPSNPPQPPAATPTDDDPYPPRSTSTTTLGSSSSEPDAEPSFDEDWDRMDSASDLDAAARALKVKDGSSTVRLKKRHGLKPRGRSPYLQLQGQGGIFEPPPLPGFTSADPNSVPGASSRHSLVQKRSFNASQSSLFFTENGTTGSTSNLALAGPNGMNGPTPRASRLSNVEEHPVALAAKHEELSSAMSTTQPRPPSHSRSSSRPSSSRSTKPPPFGSVQPPPTLTGPVYALKTGSVRSAVGPVAHSSSTSLAMTPENIKPLLENAKVVLARLTDCIEEIRALCLKSPFPSINLKR